MLPAMRWKQEQSKWDRPPLFSPSDHAILPLHVQALFAVASALRHYAMQLGPFRMGEKGEAKGELDLLSGKGILQ